MSIEYKIEFTDETLDDIDDKKNVITSIFWTLTCTENDGDNVYESSTNGEVVLITTDNPSFDTFIEYENIQDKKTQYMEWFTQTVGTHSFDRLKALVYNDLLNKKQRNITKEIIDNAVLKVV